MKSVIRAHKIRLNPTLEQENYLKQACGVARFVYNWGLEHWIKEYEAGNSPSMYKLKKQFNTIRRNQYPWTYDVDKCAIDTGFINLEKAYRTFFRGIRNKKQKIGYPKFKSRKHHMSYTIDGHRIKTEEHWIKIPKLKSKINMAEKLRFNGKIKNITISFNGVHWFASFNVEIKYDDMEATKKNVGIDVGIKQLATLSDGVIFENQEPLRHELNKLKRLNRKLSRQKNKNSNRRQKTIIQLRKLHIKIRNRRQDWLHKISTYITKTYALIGIEDLNVKGILQNHKLSRSVSDASFYEFRRMLQYKSEQWNRELVVIDRYFPSSKLCNVCGYKNDNLTLSNREWICPVCGTKHDRDLNAAINILNESLNYSGRCGFTDTINGRGETHQSL